jgi:hypothetical protein
MGWYLRAIAVFAALQVAKVVSMAIFGGTVTDATASLALAICAIAITNRWDEASRQKGDL